MHTPSLGSMNQVMTTVICNCDVGHTSKWAIKNPAITDGVVVVLIKKQQIKIN